MSGPVVALLTEGRFLPPPPPDDWYRLQVQAEDALLADAFQALGAEVRRVDWRHGATAITGADLAIIRATWDYTEAPAAFDAALLAIDGATALLNPLPLVRWNLDKHYLLDLQRSGVAIVPTRVIERGSGETLEGLVAEARGAAICVKPAVSAGARHTWRLTGAVPAEAAATFDALLPTEDWLVQPFQHRVLDEGELSLIVIGGRCTHAVQKRPAPGDFRVQDDFGGTVAPHTPSPGEIAFAEAAVRACPTPPTYARVDAVRAPDGALLLMELELVEPELFLRFNAGAPHALAAAALRAIRR
jgi:glutathione synthase/RimK-type ligase-like ATP-grasp enzyme